MELCYIITRTLRRPTTEKCFAWKRIIILCPGASTLIIYQKCNKFFNVRDVCFNITIKLKKTIKFVLINPSLSHRLRLKKELIPSLTKSYLCFEIRHAKDFGKHHLFSNFSNQSHCAFYKVYCIEVIKSKVMTYRALQHINCPPAC